MGRLSEWLTWRLSSRTTTLCSSSSPWTSRWTPPRFSFSMNILKSLLRTTVGVASDSSLAVKRWISKDVSRGGFGGPVGDGTEHTEADDATETAKIEASPEEEAAAAGSEKVTIKSEDEKSDTKSKEVIAELHNSEDAAAVMSPADETEALKDTPKPAEAKSITNSGREEESGEVKEKNL